MNLPDFSYEKKYWGQGYTLVIGVDEVGRGALAGPVIAASAAMKLTTLRRPSKSETYIGTGKETEMLRWVKSLGINDSKKLTSKKREKLSNEIKKYFHVGIGEGSVGEINKLGIVKATERAMRRLQTNNQQPTTNNEKKESSGGRL